MMIRREDLPWQWEEDKMVDIIQTKIAVETGEVPTPA